jgi:hypothetical protein
MFLFMIKKKKKNMRQGVLHDLAATWMWKAE